MQDGVYSNFPTKFEETHVGDGFESPDHAPGEVHSAYEISFDDVNQGLSDGFAVNEDHHGNDVSLGYNNEEYGYDHGDNLEYDDGYGSEDYGSYGHDDYTGSMNAYRRKRQAEQPRRKPCHARTIKLDDNVRLIFYLYVFFVFRPSTTRLF